MIAGGKILGTRRQALAAGKGSGLEAAAKAGIAEPEGIIGKEAVKLRDTHPAAPYPQPAKVKEA